MASRRRGLPLLGILFTTAASAIIVAACGGDDKTIYVYVQPDAASDASKTTTVIPGDDDSGSTATDDCTPQAAAPYTFKPAGKYQDKCTQTELTSFAQGCFGDSATSDTCNNASTTLSDDCATCLVGTPQDTITHPFYFFSTSQGNIGPIPASSVCMAAYANEGTSNSDCSYAFGEIELCAYESCISSCLTADEATYQNCLSDSLGTTCTNGLATFTSSKCNTAYKSDTTYGFCLGDYPDGGSLPNVDFAYSVANIICGIAPEGGSPQDAGTDAGDGGDGGDGGPQ